MRRLKWAHVPNPLEFVVADAIGKALDQPACVDRRGEAIAPTGYHQRRLREALYRPDEIEPRQGRSAPCACLGAAGEDHLLAEVNGRRSRLRTHEQIANGRVGDWRPVRPQGAGRGQDRAGARRAAA
jgi:hypothetical protein